VPEGLESGNFAFRVALAPEKYPVSPELGPGRLTLSQLARRGEQIPPWNVIFGQTDDAFGGVFRVHAFCGGIICRSSILSFPRITRCEIRVISVSSRRGFGAKSAPGSREGEAKRKKFSELFLWERVLRTRNIVKTLPAYLPAVEDDEITRITRLIRRICVLREQGETAEAQDLERGQFAAALNELHASEGADALPDDEVQRIFVAERARAAEAQILAAMLIPQLIGHFPPSTAPAQNHKPALPRPVPPPPDLRPVVNGGTPAIPDLLDSMLARESAAARRK
jgi:hypothetical protein